MHYTDERNVQILVALLKEHGIRKVVVSPGTTNITFVRSLQIDAHFEMYSSVDERSAAYIACGLAAESGEPVVLSCTGATASRNYLPGMTEAFYRKLPILAVTSTQDITRVDHLIAQVIDRSAMPKDVYKISVQLPLVKDNNDWWSCEVKANNAILGLFWNGGGPVHINLTTGYSQIYKAENLPTVRVIKRITAHSKEYPIMPECKIAVLIGSHAIMTEEQINALERFCETNNAVVFCDHTSGYKGKYCVVHSLSSSQREADFNKLKPDILIHIGEITGDYSADNIVGKELWRVNIDGALRDTYRKLKYIFEMPEEVFFKHYTKLDSKGDTYLKAWREHLEHLFKMIPELPFSNLWIAKTLHKLIPEKSTIHFGILNSLRSWNFFDLPETVESNANVGGFGIDGIVSTLIGASLARKDRIYFGVVGDLAFFYDINSLGNRHLGKNLRILLVNNGIGTEFKNFNHKAAIFEKSADDFIAAGGHFGNKSRTIVKNYSENLGFEYLAASNKTEFDHVYQRFLTDQMLDKPLLLEVFTDSVDESKALEIITSISTTAIRKTKNALKNILGETNVSKIKSIVHR